MPIPDVEKLSIDMADQPNRHCVEAPPQPLHSLHTPDRLTTILRNQSRSKTIQSSIDRRHGSINMLTLKDSAFHTPIITVGCDNFDLKTQLTAHFLRECEVGDWLLFLETR